MIGDRNAMNVPYVLVDTVCPLCSMVISSTSQKWEERVLLETDNPRVLQYAHKKCVDRTDDSR
jgi:predicted DCC family thiol-disulfide oxidoreductase YuxK